MLVVETIAKIRRLSLVQGKSIKAICRELKISRKVVRKVLRSDETEFRYERKHQPFPEDGGWREKLDCFCRRNAAKPQRERLTLIRIYEELRGLGYDGSYDRCGGMRRIGRTRRCRGRGLCSAELRAGRGLPVRLEPRDRPAGRRDGDGEGGACAALPQPHDVRSGLSARDAGDGVRRP
jgi:hypothetical protein